MSNCLGLPLSKRFTHVPMYVSSYVVVYANYCIQLRSIKILGKNKKNLVDTFLKGIASEIQNMNCKCAAIQSFLCISIHIFVCN